MDKSAQNEGGMTDDDRCGVRPRSAGIRKTLYRVSRTILSSDADCCDAVQEALTRAWKHRNDVNPRFFKTWLLRILINECHNIGRRLKRMIPVEEMPEWPAPQAEETGVMEALQRIKEPWRIVLIMHELEGFTYAEIASVTRVPETQSNIALFKLDVPFGGK